MTGGALLCAVICIAAAAFGLWVIYRIDTLDERTGCEPGTCDRCGRQYLKRNNFGT